MNYEQLRHLGLRHETAVTISEAIDEAAREERLATLRMILDKIDELSPGDWAFERVAHFVRREIARVERDTPEAE